jgi:2-polyprenyl-6-hydroxyphenyl methylase/3-demethylubiquinone-9 3-methyltransferase
LVDIACGGGLLAPHAAAKGYRHIGVDIGERATAIATTHGVSAVRGDALRLPIASDSADVVVAGEILEHVADPEALIAEAARVLRPGGLFICDSLADTRLCKLLMVDIAERLPFVPAGIHDPRLFVDPRRIVRACARADIRLDVRGLRPSIVDGLAWLAGRRDNVAMHPTRFTGVVWQGIGVRCRRD